MDRDAGAAGPGETRGPGRRPRSAARRCLNPTPLAGAAAPASPPAATALPAPPALPRATRAATEVCATTSPAPGLLPLPVPGFANVLGGGRVADTTSDGGAAGATSPNAARPPSVPSAVSSDSELSSHSAAIANLLHGLERLTPLLNRRLAFTACRACCDRRAAVPPAWLGKAHSSGCRRGQRVHSQRVALARVRVSCTAIRVRAHIRQEHPHALIVFQGCSGLTLRQQSS